MRLCDAAAGRDFQQEVLPCLWAWVHLNSIALTSIISSSASTDILHADTGCQAGGWGWVLEEREEGWLPLRYASASCSHAAAFAGKQR